jgi:hypothetical protein
MARVRNPLAGHGIRDRLLNVGGRLTLIADVVVDPKPIEGAGKLAD